MPTSQIITENKFVFTDRTSRRLGIHALVTCWLGMVFDGMDTNNYILTMHPALGQLLHTTSASVIGAYGAGILAGFMVGWAVGAILFGLLADYIGRARTLVITVLLYALCTGLCAFVHSWQELAILRFLVGCGIGGEASIGGVILAELFSGQRRLHATGFLQTGFPCGLLLLAGINLLIGHLGWRWLYLTGMVPALLAIYMRMKLDDAEDYKKVRAQRESLRLKPKDKLNQDEIRYLDSPFIEFFSTSNAPKTVVLLILGSCVCIGAYAVLSWMPPWINQLMGAAAVNERSYAAISQSLGNILGSASAGIMIMWIGRKWVFRMAFLVALAVCSLMFLTTKAFGLSLLVWAFLAGFFVFAPFAYLFVYVPELFATHLRATAFAFCIQSGRLLCAAACLAGGYLVGLFGGSYALAGASLALVYLLGFLATFFMPHSRGTVSSSFDV